MKAIWNLLRLEHGIMYGIGVIIGIYISSPHYSNIINILLGFLAAVFLQASAFALNDYLDYEVDLANKRFDRPLVRGDLSRKTALLLALILLPFGFIASALISLNAFLLALIITALGYLYNIKLKEFGFAGNVYIALSMATPFIFGSVVATNQITPSSILLSIIAFLSGLGREVMKGIEDVEGDALRNIKSIARIKGPAFASKVAAFFIVVAVLISPVPFLCLKQYYMDPKYAIPVAITDVILIYVALNLIKFYEREKIKKYRKETLIAMIFGLFGFLIGAF